MLTAVLVSFAVIGLGWLARRLDVVAAGAEKVFNDYLYHIAMPALIFGKLSSAGLSGVGWRLIAANSLPVVAIIVLILGLRRAGIAGPGLAGELLITSAFGNTVYLGFPVVALRLGGSFLALAAIVTSVHYLIVFTAGLAALAAVRGAGGTAARSMLLKNNIFWSSAAGAAFSLAGMEIPSAAEGFLSMLGDSTAPLALFSMGLFLYGRKIGGRKSAVALLCLFKLAVFPALFLVSADLFSLGGAGAKVSMLEAMMPLAVTNFVLARKLGMDEEVVAEAILASTLAVIPLLLGFDWVIDVL